MVSLKKKHAIIILESPLNIYPLNMLKIVYFGLFSHTL